MDESGINLDSFTRAIGSPGTSLCRAVPQCDLIWRMGYDGATCGVGGVYG